MAIRIEKMHIINITKLTKRKTQNIGHTLRKAYAKV